MKDYIIEAKKQGQITASQPHINQKLQEYVEQRTEFLKTYGGIQLWREESQAHSAEGGGIKLKALEKEYNEAYRKLNPGKPDPKSIFIYSAPANNQAGSAYYQMASGNGEALYDVTEPDGVAEYGVARQSEPVHYDTASDGGPSNEVHYNTASGGGPSNEGGLPVYDIAQNTG
ncbi:hypothetical protein OAT84_00670 [Gammaproteobacteria bacterium]|nr:hypothetical protein [Gammaproteobacteria bacterium]